MVPFLAPHLQNSWGFYCRLNYSNLVPLLAPCLHLCATSYSVSAIELTVLMLPFAHWFLYGFFSGIYSDDVKHILLKLSCADMWYFNEFQVANGT